MLEIRDKSWYKAKAKEVDQNLKETWLIGFPIHSDGHRMVYFVKTYNPSLAFLDSEVFSR